MRPTEYEGLRGEELVQRVMRDKGVSKDTAEDVVMLWNHPEGDVEELPPLPAQQSATLE